MVLSESPKIQAFNMDCMEFMKDKPDNYYDLAIVDPPHNVGASDGKFGQNSKDYHSATMKHYANNNKTPSIEYFKEMFRVSKNQIIWGSNYYPQYLEHSGAIIWHKKSVGPLSDCEIAYQSFNKLVKYCFFEWFGFNKGFESGVERVHPNQKPVQLYKWTLQNYAKEGDKILDTHGGSFSSAIACHMEGFDLDICELDGDYFNDAVKRFKLNTIQERLF